MKFSLLCLSGLIICIVGIFHTANAQLVPKYVSDAVYKSVQPPDKDGKWVIIGTVKLYRPNGEELEAGGLMTVANGILSGDLALKVAGGSYIKDNTVHLTMTLAEPFKVGLRHDLKLKPYLGSTLQYAKFKNVPNSPYTSGKVVWDNEETPVSIYLGWDKAKTGKPYIREKPEKPIGARYQVTGYMEVTNAEDGVLGTDNTCEIYGSVSLWLVEPDNKYKLQRDLFKLIPQDAMKGFKLSFDKNIYIDRYYDNKYWNRMSIRGSIQDQDGGVVDQSDDDMLWQTGQAVRFGGVDDPVGTVKNFVMPGDRSSENAEVYVTLTLVEKLYPKKP